jgi:hypothetical protein
MYCRPDEVTPQVKDSPISDDYEQMLMRLMDAGNTNRRTGGRCVICFGYDFEAAIDAIRR